ncbi:MAG: radical SAM protein [Spirochaetes bacterium GWF1_41_5]|nr:MAG: radical SAM protein [Spirochaetes bacterium GWF1_41_5]HBE03332.1 radical SAM protein [Spirochaetia bacterium]
MQASCIVTFRCNARCTMCNIWKNPTKPSEELAPEYYEKLPDNMRINITGGEPMLRDDIDEIFKILYPKASLLELSTNGYYTEKIVNIAEKYPKLLIRVSIEGLPAVNDRQRGIKDGFDHALRTMLELKKTKCKNIGFSIVITDRNIDDLLCVYELSNYLGVELGNSVMHNSWYFHTEQNIIQDTEKAFTKEMEFIAALLQSKRKGFKKKIKDYGRAYFNKSIAGRFRGNAGRYRPACGALKDFFFIDPAGNVIPCNGTGEKWILGNIKDDTFQNIVSGNKATEILKKIKECRRDCCFIVTDRHDMARNPWKPVMWILKNKLRLFFNKPVILN